MMIYLLFILSSGVCFVSSEIKTYRLPTDATPSLYTIRILPDFDNDAFDGEVSIYVRSRVVLDKIILHSSQLNVTKVFINRIEGNVAYENDEKISLQYANESIQPGEHLLHIKYRGVVRKRGTGLLAALSNSEDLGYLFVTDFEPTGARRVFPCFDEPSFKAKFNLRLISPNDTYRAIANMAEINTFRTSYGIVHDFATSVIMSTYLLTFALTTYPYYEEIYEGDNRSIPIRIYASNASKSNNEFTLNCTKNALKFYSDYTKISYPLSKLDMTEFDRPDSAATENWGLITFRKGLLSINLDIYDKDQIKLVVYHELSHFWFGNLVTNDWWNDIWLQESFATYMTYKLSASENNSQQPRKIFFFDAFNEVDEYLPSRPIVDYLSSHDHIEKSFQPVVYNKGAAVLEMIEGVIGEEAFQKVLQRFLAKYAYRTATTNDFILTLEEVVPGHNIRGVIESYVYQTSFPVISVDGNNGKFILTQTVGPTVADYSGSGQKWTVPIEYVTEKNVSKYVWFDKDMDSLIIEEPEAKWILLNSQGTGLYKVNYSEKTWKELHLQQGELTQKEYIALVDNANYAFKFGVSSCDILLNFMKEVKKKKYWSFLADFHNRLKEMLRCNEYKEELDIYMNFLYKRFNETNYLKKPLVNTEDECHKGEGLLTHEKQKESLQKCAKWIKENIPSSNDVTYQVVT